MTKKTENPEKLRKLLDASHKREEVLSVENKLLHAQVDTMKEAAIHALQLLGLHDLARWVLLLEKVTNTPLYPK